MPDLIALGAPMIEQRDYQQRIIEKTLDAVKEGADYIGFGPVFETPTKPTYRPVGLEPISSVLEQVQVPVVCIGGINLSNVSRVRQAGADRVAVVRAIFSADDPCLAAQQLRDEIMSGEPQSTKIVGRRVG